MDQEMLKMIYITAVSVPGAVLAYNMIPAIFSANMIGYDHREKKNIIRTLVLRVYGMNPHTGKIFESMLKRSRAAGADTKHIYFIALSFIAMPFLILLSVIFDSSNSILSISLGLTYISIVNIRLNQMIKKRKDMFTVNAYKIYYFLHSQISSGIKPTDALKGVHEICENKVIREIMTGFVGRYQLSMDIDDSLKIIKESLSGYDVEMLCVSIKQCVETGQTGKTLLKMEKMMFSKFFYILQKETERYRFRLLLCGILGIIPIVCMLGLPVIYEALSGFRGMLYQ